MQAQPFVDLASFATEDRISRLVAKERGKYAAKGGSDKNRFAKDKLYQTVHGMTPKHSLWCKPGRGQLPKRVDHGYAKWSGKKKRPAVRVYLTLKKYLHAAPEDEWKIKLKEFIASVQEALSGKGELVLETPRILPKFKEVDEASGDRIYRPICKYSDLKSKIIIALAYQYILENFDRYFHRDMLFMRRVRRVGEKKYKVPAFTDAIDMVTAYRKKNNDKTIYVGECDIQKFYDIFNHDVIMDCFEDLFDEVKRDKGAKDEDFDSLRRVIEAYLDSYDYPSQVMALNSDPDYWRDERKRRSTEAHPDPVCRFKWVKEEAFVSSGCYTEEEFREARDSGVIGIPQGGALSGIMVNVVMRMVDKPIVSEADPQRLFIRYCDDILLMHTDRARCEDYLERYYNQLVRCRLVPHPRRDISDFKHGDNTTAGFWHSKSKNVYRWGSGGGDASDWVAFVGYEMRRTGEIRIRKDKIDAEFKRIARCYYDIICSKAVTSGEPLTDAQKAELMERMDKAPQHILDYDKAWNNLYSRSQARRLDKYLYRKTRKAARKIGIEDSKAAARQRQTYIETVKQKARPQNS